MKLHFKKKGISLVSSNKNQCPLHSFRLNLARYYQKSDFVDVMGTYDNGNPIAIADSLTDYHYSIVIENNITSCYFTEKLLNCFASMTIPVYLGASNIGEYFNIDGIVHISPDMNEGEIDKVLSECTDEFYNSRIEAIKDNYYRIREYMCIEDYLYSHYKELIT